MMEHGTLPSTGSKLPQANRSLPQNSALHLQQPCKKNASKVAFYCMHMSVLMGKNHVMEERGEGYILLFILCKGIELAERWVGTTIAVNRGDQ